ncbi:zinc finger matrin-type protein 1 [Sinocyclocheilus rhinocerous]|uniref:C2H2-type domain-containing protein n=1 Tax=Sinocyclocheilus rhinocerous TaxID=307959 RepID=A0A673LJB5_9TELE|nr:PREDICTED: lysine-rich coiled-coil protein 1 [Sinocyclocheilus rhinocerous]
MSELEASVSCSPQCAETDKTKNTDDINPETVQNTNTNISQVEEGSQGDSDLLKGLLTDNFCHICEATLLYESQRVSHYEGKKHAQRVRMYLQSKKAKINKLSQDCGGLLRGLSAEKFCELCNMVFSSPTVAKSHYEGKVHAKNMRKTNPPPPEAPVLESTTPVVLPSEAAVQNQISQEQNTSGSGDQEVDLSDPNKYCTLCSASFNNPLVAQQHYSGRKHQRSQARQEMLDQMGEQSEHVSSLTCPICCLTLSSIEMYQAHMQGNKHIVKEKKVMELCKSQKKVYDSFQDELADYIQVQKARGLEPKAGPGTIGQANKDLDESVKEGPQKAEEMPHPGKLVPRFPPPGFPQPHWHPHFQSQVNQFGFGMRGPVPHYRPGYMPHVHPPFTPGHLCKRGRSPESFSSSSFSDSSSYTSSSSDSSSSYDSKERRRRKRKMKKGGKSRRDQEEGSDTERGERKKRRKGDRGGSVEGEDDRKKWKERRKRERSSSEDEESIGKSRASKKSRRHGDGQHAKRRKEAELLVKQEIEVHEEPQGKMEEQVEVRTETKDGKHKHKKERKKGKEKMNQEDNRTEEERLWDETILGVF